MRFDKRGVATLILLMVPFAGGQSSENKHLIYKKKYIMGTVFEIAAYGESSEHTSAVIEKAFQEIVRIDDLMSNYKPDSALSNLNRSAHYHAQKVPPDLYRAIRNFPASLWTLQKSGNNAICERQTVPGPPAFIATGRTQ